MRIKHTRVDDLPDTFNIPTRKENSYKHLNIKVALAAIKIFMLFII